MKCVLELESTFFSLSGWVAVKRMYVCVCVERWDREMVCVCVEAGQGCVIVCVERWGRGVLKG